MAMIAANRWCSGSGVAPRPHGHHLGVLGERREIGRRRLALDVA